MSRAKLGFNNKIRINSKIRDQRAKPGNIV